MGTIKILGSTTMYGGGGSGADAPPLSQECDYNSTNNSPGLDFSDDADEGDWDFN
jgi:hypothetical protein